MKLKIKFNRRHSMIITLLASACSLWLMMKSFHFPAEEILKIAVICFVLIVPLIVCAALVAFISRKARDQYLKHEEKEIWQQQKSSVSEKTEQESELNRDAVQTGDGDSNKTDNVKIEEKKHS